MNKRPPSRTIHKTEIQGEGDYKSARRFNQAQREFVATHDTASLGRRAAPKSPAEAADLRRAEAAGRARSASGGKTSSREAKKK